MYNLFIAKKGCTTKNKQCISFLIFFFVSFVLYMGENIISCSCACVFVSVYVCGCVCLVAALTLYSWVDLTKTGRRGRGQDT